MPIRYITGGDEVKAKSLLGEGRHQLSILKNAMSFQKLKQLERMVILPDGTLIKCSSCFGLDIVNVFAPSPEVLVPVIEEEKIIPITIEPKEYDFSFKLTRGDGRIVGGSLLITVYNSKEEEIAITTPEYNEITQYWGFNLEDPEDKDPDGFWISYRCSYGLYTQYPYRYMPEDFSKSKDLIHLGTYEDTIPYWKIDTWDETYPFVPPPKGVTEITPEVAEWIESGKYIVYKKVDFYTKKGLSTIGFTYTRKITSSVPYNVQFRVTSHFFNYQYTRPENCDVSTFIPDPTIPIYDVLTPGGTIVCNGPELSGSLEQQIFESANMFGATYTMEVVPRMDTTQDAWCWAWTDEGTHKVWNHWKHQWEYFPGHWYELYFTGEVRWLYIRSYTATLTPLELSFYPTK